MKFLSLGLSPFGPFSNMGLDFQTNSNLHLVVGPNEAGKSTTLRAIRGFLFGIPKQSPDVHTHEGKHLRVHATLEGADGSTLELVRRKGNKNDLLFADETVADEAVLTRLLSGVDLEYFTSMFGLTHGDLVEGGQTLLAQEGSLGEALFGAGTGSGMRSVLAALGDEAREVFRKTGKNQPLNQAIAAFKEAKKATSTAVLKPKDWRRVSEELADAEATLEKFTEERTAKRLEEQKLSRLKIVIPTLGAIRGYRESLRALPDAPRLHASARSERQNAESRLRDLETRNQKLLDERARNDEKAANLSVSPSILERKQQLASLAEDLGAYKKASGDVPGLRSRVEAGRGDIAAALRSLGKEDHLDDLESIRVTEQTQATLRELANARGGLDKHLEQARRSVRQAKERRQTLEDERASLPKVRDVGALAMLVKDVQKRGDLEQSLRELAADIASRESEVDALLARIGRYEGSAEACCALALPSAETVEEHRANLERCATELQASRTDERKLQDKQAEVASAIEALVAGGAVHTHSELEEVRIERDRQWSEVRGCWLEGHESASGSASELAETLSSSIGRADQIADGLRDDAKRSGQLENLKSEQKRVAEQLNRQQQQSTQLSTKQEALEAAWRGLWEPTNVVAGTPTEMRSWLGKHEKLVLALDGLKDLRREHEEARAVIAAQRSRLDAALLAIEEPASGSDESLSLLLDRCSGICEASASNARLVEQWKRNIEEATNAETQALAELPAAEGALEAWQASWARSAQDAGLSANASASEMEAVLRGLSVVFEKWSTVRQTEARIEHIEEDLSAFETKVANLARECAPQLVGRPTAEAAAALGEALSETVRANDARMRLLERKTEIEGELAAIAIDVETQNAILQQLVNQAGVSDETMLASVEDESDRQRELHQKLADAEQSLHGVGVPIGELELEAKDVSIDSLAGSLEAVVADLEELDARIREQHDEVARLRQEFAAMDESSAASKAAEDAETALADIRSHAATYARLILAEHILAAEIERYRKENQGPVLARAGEMFRRMTLDGFAGLGTEYNNKDEPVLVCRRDSGESIEVAGLSDGTRDQLYLALRLASLELHAKHNEPLPLIMDDLLINFDDERAGATLGLLAEVAETTQILFFSHHSHLLDVARQAVPEGRWQEHRLVEG